MPRHHDVAVYLKLLLHRLPQLQLLKVLATITALCLNGCQSDGKSSIGTLAEIIAQGNTGLFGGVDVQLEQAAKIPFASMGYRVNGGNQNILILATEVSGDLLWTSPEKVVVVTRAGRIIQTVGLGGDLGRTTPSIERVLLPPESAIESSFNSTRLYDFPDRGLYGIAVACHARVVGDANIIILGRIIPTIEIGEDCVSTDLTWNFTDTFWVGKQTGRVLRARQHIHPSGKKIEVEVLRAFD